MKFFYYDIKNKYSEDNKYLAVINSNGLWIRDKINNEINFINADSLEENILNNVSITRFSEELKSIFLMKKLHFVKNRKSFISLSI